jgi:hypothetical protein
MRNCKLEVVRRKTVAALAGCAIAALCWSSGGLANAQTPAVNLPPGVQDVVKLSQAGLGEDVIMAQVKNAGATYNLNADQLIYLSKAGVSQNVIKALIGTGGGAASAAPPMAPPPAYAPSSPAVAPPPTSYPPTGTAPVAPGPAGPPDASAPPPTMESFQQQLAPYGTWVQVPGYGLCWRPAEAAFDVHWRPYGYAGHWTYTDSGWYWASDYPWGGIAFHYGRWVRDPLGWVWVPGYDWAPAWVAWRHTDGYVGWAALPPAAVFRAGIGLEFNGHIGVDLDFGLGADAFLFVGYDHFWDHDLHGYFLPHDRVDFLFHHSVIMNGYRFDHGRFIVEGLGRDRIGLYTHREVRVEGFGRDFHDGRHIEPGRGGFRDDRHDGHDGHDGFH